MEFRVMNHRKCCRRLTVNVHILDTQAYSDKNHLKKIELK